ncbi:MAG TPA: hypothetical protein VFC57_00965 [Aeromicrobium sp.]|nr:hypothetical protein [Aeromicrobium sp.]
MNSPAEGDILGDIQGTLLQHGGRLDQQAAVLDQHTVALGEHGTTLDHIIDLLETR